MGNETEKIKVELRPGETPQDITKAMNQNIFRSTGNDYNDELKKIEEKVRKEKKRRYMRIHVWAKNKLFKNGLKILKKVLKKYLIKSLDDIPPVWCNNHHRMFYHSFEKGLDDVFKMMIFPMRKCGSNRFEDPDDYLAFIKEVNYWSYCNRKDIIGLWMVEIMEDTVDREWINFFCMRLYWYMHDFYKGKVPKPGDYPIYKSMWANNPRYFLENRHRKAWIPPLEKEKKIDKWVLDYAREEREFAIVNRKRRMANVRKQRLFKILQPWRFFVKEEKDVKKN